MVNITLCNTESAAGIDQGCFYQLPSVIYFFCFQCVSGWFTRKLVFLLFYNADIIPVSKFLYFFFFLFSLRTRLHLSTNAAVIRLSANTTALQP